MNELLTWDFQGNEVRTLDIDGEPWWVLADVCRAIEISQIVHVVERLDEDEVRLTEVIDTLGRAQNTYIVNEYGLYETIIRSDKPKAKPFRKWITHEVLPAIRKTGRYEIPKAEEEIAERLPYEYLTIAKIVSRCNNDRLPFVLKILEKGGYDLPVNYVQVKKPVDTSDIGERIEEAMSIHKMSVNKMAAWLNLTRQTVYRYLNGTRYPSPETYRKILRSLERL